MDPNKQPQDDFNFDDFINPADKPLLDAERAKEGIVTPDATTVVPESLPAEVVETPSPQTPEIPKDDTVPTVETAPAEGIDSDLPVRAPNEPEWRYNFRVEIHERQKALRNASTDTQKKEIKGEVDGIRKQIAQRAKAEDVVVPDSVISETYPKETFDSDVEKFNVIAKNSGYLHKSEIADVIRQQTMIAKEYETVGKAETDFRARHPDLKDQAKYDNLVEFVLENFIIQGKSYNGLTAILETAKDMLYPTQIEAKTAKTQELSKKMDAVDFSGSTAAESDDPIKREQKTLVEDIKKTTGNDFGWAFD